MRLSEFAYDLPPGRIAQYPAAERGASRMLVVPRGGPAGECEDRKFADLRELLRGDELIIVNNARVIPARLFGRRAGVLADGGDSRGQGYLSARIEVLLTRQIAPDEWAALVRPGRKMRVGERVLFGEGALEAEVVGRGEFGVRRLRFLSPAGDSSGPAKIEQYGHIPLPPYIARPDEASDRERYQTVFANQPGAVAAPTAGLHFTPEILREIQGRGIEVCAITLFVGLGTFQPVRVERVEDHVMHSEAYEITGTVIQRIRQARDAGSPVLAVGTTVVRALEDAATKGFLDSEKWDTRGAQGEASLFIFPGYEFRVVRQLLTNFHLPKSSLLILVAAFAGRERILSAYQHAIQNGYSFYSYGDCMLIR